MRTFTLIAVEATEGQWEMNWGSDGSPISPPEMHWIVSAVAQAILDKSRRLNPNEARGGLILPSQN